MSEPHFFITVKDFEDRVNDSVKYTAQEMARLKACERELKELKNCIKFMINYDYDYVDLKISKNAMVKCNNWYEILEMCANASEPRTEINEKNE